MIVVSDTTPLLTLFKIGRIDVLNKLYNSVHIPFAVFEELTRNTEYPEEAEYFRNCPFCKFIRSFPQKEYLYCNGRLVWTWAKAKRLY